MFTLAGIRRRLPSAYLNEIVHVTGTAVWGSPEGSQEEIAAWVRAFSVFDAFLSADKATSGYASRREYWDLNREDFKRQLIRSTVSPRPAFCPQ